MERVVGIASELACPQCARIPYGACGLRWQCSRVPSPMLEQLDDSTLARLLDLLAESKKGGAPVN